MPYNVVFQKSNGSRFLHTFSSKQEYLAHQHLHTVLAEGISFEAAETLCHSTLEIFRLIDAIDSSSDQSGKIYERVLRQNVTRAIIEITYGRLHGQANFTTPSNLDIPLPPLSPQSPKDDLIHAIYSVCNLRTGQVDINLFIHLINQYLIDHAEI